MNKIKNTWFTSDTHLGHANIIKFSNRPFEDIDEMNETIIREWNKVVQQYDDVYHLGDVSLMNSDKTYNALMRLNGNIHLINGNHEKSILSSQKCRDRFVWIKDKHQAYFDLNELNHQVPTKNKEVLIVMDHYAHRVWNKSHHGAWMLYGHSHDSMEHTPWGRSMDVGVDSAYRILGAYRPFNFDEIKRIMDKRTDNPVDHHIVKR